MGSFVNPVINLCHIVTRVHCNGVTVIELTIMRHLVVLFIDMDIYYRSEYSLLELFYIVFDCDISQTRLALLHVKLSVTMMTGLG